MTTPEPTLAGLLAAVARGAAPAPFALLYRPGHDRPERLGDHLDVLTGDVTTVDRLADIPLPDGPPGPATLALVPFRQVAERGFACVDDGAPLECLVVRSAAAVPLAGALAMLAELPDPPAHATDRATDRATDHGFDVPDEEYAATVAAVLRDEIGRGEGANFVIHRTYRADLAGDPLVAALVALRRLLVGERGAYWTFLVHTGTRTLVGATPERHVSAAGGLVMMNPISGTHRPGPAQGRGVSAGEPRRPGPISPVDADVDDLLRFLADPKEIDELYMVLDEELKMMAAVAEDGGQVIGPYLKEMAHLTHTEYLLAGRGGHDVREVLRATMFAPTVTGSPIENALRVIARHERRGRGYYAGVLALLGRDAAGRQTLDAPILIRTAEISPAGRLRLPVGATLVRHSTPAGEVAETHTKAAGMLAALGLASVGSRPVAAVPAPPLADDPRVRAALAARNADLAPFWLEDRAGVDPDGPLPGLRALIVDAEDTFTGMLAHQLRALGLAVTVLPSTAVPGAAGLGAGLGPEDFDLVVAGPGPGDPEDPADEKMAALRGLVDALLSAGRPVLGVCLGHQILAGRLGLRMHRRAAPYQGLARDVDLFGTVRRVGFYATYTPVSDVDFLPTPYGVAALARDPVDGAVHALRGPAFAGVQFHPESVLSRDGVTVLADLLTHLLTPTVVAAN